MTGLASIPFAGRFALSAFLIGVASPVAATTDAHLIESYGELPVQFEANGGQRRRLS
jgi:hypothetical protein